MSQVRRLHEVRVEHEVPFHDVDPVGVVWHGHYYKYFELARTKLLRSIDLDQGDLVGPHFRLLVTETYCKYLHALRYGERFVVSAWLRDFRHRLDIAYEITSRDHDHTSARGHTLIVSTDIEGRLLLRIPPAIRERIER